MGNMIKKNKNEQLVVLIKMGQIDKFESLINSIAIDVSNILDLFVNVDLDDSEIRKMYIGVIKNKKIQINPYQYLSTYNQDHLFILLDYIPEYKLINYLKKITSIFPIIPKQVTDNQLDTLNLILHTAFHRKMYKLQIEWIKIVSKLYLIIEPKNFINDISFNPHVALALLKYTSFDKSYLSNNQCMEICNIIN